MSNPSSFRYAKALFDLGVETNQLDKLEQEIRAVGELVAGNEGLSALLSNPSLGLVQRKAVMSDLASKMQLVPLVKNALLYITDHGRGAQLPQIAAALTRLSEDRAGKVRAEVTSAQTLTDAQAARVSAAVEKLTGRKVSLSRKVDPNLIGGAVLKIGDKVYDGSVKTKLVEIRQSLLPN